MRVWVAGLVAAVLAVLGLSIAVVVAVSGSDRVAIVDLAVGDCFDLSDTGADDVGVIETVSTVSCDEPHLAEVVSAGQLEATDDGAYPSDDGVFAAVDRRCRADQPELDVSAFGLLPVAPTEQRWERDDRGYLCVAIPFGGEPVVGSATAP